jgi:hypothetical protein
VLEIQILRERERSVVNYGYSWHMRREIECRCHLVWGEMEFRGCVYEFNGFVSWTQEYESKADLCLIV